MTRPATVLVVGLVLVLLVVGMGAGVWYYLFGANAIDSADLVPANTIFFASIPNAAVLVEGYELSQAKSLISSPDAKLAHDELTNLIGQKNVDLFHAFLPNLSGQSFIAVTHFDYDHPEKIGLIAAMKPKAGSGDFGSFLDKLKATWPDVIKQGRTGTATVEGVDYNWIQGPGASDRICVAQIGGWIVTTWGEASLQDWIERYRGKSSTSSLAKDMNYENSISRVGDNPMTLLYVNYHLVVETLQKQLAKTNPAAGDYMANKLASVGGAAVATRFENGEIVDRFSFMYPRPAQVEAGMGTDPCPFETLKFTGPDTRFYWATTMNWKQYAKIMHDQTRNTEGVNPVANNAANFIENWIHGAGLDTQQNIIEALGSEISVQAEWPSDATYPEVGLFVKLDKPENFKPTTAAIISTVRQMYAASGEVKEQSVANQHLATLQFHQGAIFSPTITEDGPYLGVFLMQDQAMKSFQRTDSAALTHNADFTRQIGDKRDGAAQVLFLDTPYLVNRAYSTALPYLSLAQMFDKNISTFLGGQQLPPDLNWLAPMGTWSYVITPDEEGIVGYSVSGIGNQGIFLASAAGAGSSVLQSMGLLPKQPFPAESNFFAKNMPIPSPTSTATPQPDAQANPAASNAPNAVTNSVISITVDNKIYFDGTLVPSDQIGDYLKAQKAANQRIRLTVLVDRDASPDALSSVMDAGASAGFGVLTYTYTKQASPVSSTNSDMPVAPTVGSPAPKTDATPVPMENATTNAATSLSPTTNPDGTIPAPLPPQ